MDKEALERILKQHDLWFRTFGVAGGALANLRNANLRGADLRGANLINADLRNANLRGANLRGADLLDADLINADLRGANLRNADLRGANLINANLRNANLRGADLRDANLQDADLRGANLQDEDLRDANLQDADLRGANLIGAKYTIPLACPDEGSFIGWKVIFSDNVLYLIKLLIPEDAKRSSATGRKCRCSKAITKAIFVVDTDKSSSEYGNIAPANTDIVINYNYNIPTDYIIGKVTYPDSFDENRFNECSNGIHFFITKEEAIEYGLR